MGTGTRRGLVVVAACAGVLGTVDQRRRDVVAGVVRSPDTGTWPAATAHTRPMRSTTSAGATPAWATTRRH